MKKIININFHGRVIPIEETAFDMLTQYVESLRKYFANEEGRDEIINDIENRFAELFSERLKKDSNCITDNDVNSIIDSMGRPADFEAADADAGFSTASAAATDNKQGAQSEPSQKTYTTYNTSSGRGRLYRNADDKVLGGVCSGLANYLGIDPIIMRIAFFLLIAALFWVYILLWIVVPSQSQQSNITKRLFRSADERVIGGVAGGLAAYFNIQVWIPRLVFALPFILWLISGIFHGSFWHWDFAPRFISGGLGGTLFFSYIILWIAVPVANSASEKLEMRGERVDLNSIANTIKDDLEGFKGRAEKVGAEFKESAQKFSTEFKNTAQQKSKDLSYEIGQRRGGFGHAIGVLFKAFFLFIASIIALSLFGVLIGLLFGGMVAMPLKDFFLSGVGENFLAWMSIILFLGIPLIAILTWLIRRIMGARSKNHYLGYVFGTLWVIGLISIIILVSDFARNFRTKDFVEENMNISQPSNGKIFVDLTSGRMGFHYYSHRWNWVDWENDLPIYGDNFDSLLLNTVRVDIVKSKDAFFHIQKLKFSRGRTQKQAQALAQKIDFDIAQEDSVLLLPKGGFAISKNDKFRNQQVLVVIEVPVGKKIQISNSIHNYNWFNINIGRRNGWNVSDNDEWNDDWDNKYRWDSDTEYIMTATGLERMDKNNDNSNDVNQRKATTPKSDNGYRYKGHDSISAPKETAPKKDSTTKQKTAIETEKKPEEKATAVRNAEADESDDKSSSPVSFLSMILQS